MNRDATLRAFSAVTLGSEWLTECFRTRRQLGKFCRVRGFEGHEFAAPANRAILPTYCFILIFPVGTGSARGTLSRRLGELRLPRRRTLDLGRAAPSHARGARPMENALLIGLSRQIALHRELDVVANNIANLNTTGYKADNSVFEEYPDAGRAAPSGFQAADRRLSFVQDRATWHDFSAGPGPADRQSARRRHRRRRLPGGADAARRALHPQRRLADQRHRRSSSPAPATRCSATAGRSSSRPPTATSRSTPTARSRCAKAANSKSDSARGKLRLVRFDSVAAAAEGRLEPVHRPRRRHAAAGPRSVRVIQGAIEGSRTCAASSR